MPIYNTESISPRETIQHDWDLEDRSSRFNQEREIALINRDTKKLEIRLKQEDATKARRHQQLMKQLELDIRLSETRWTQIYRLPVLIILLPIKFVMAFAVIVAAIKGTELPENFWRYLK